MSVKPKVLVTRVPSDASVLDRMARIADLTVWRHDRAVDREYLVSESRDAVGIYSMLTDTIDAEVIDGAPDLRVVSNMAVGVDNIDLAACRAAGIVVGHTPDVLTDTTADTAWELILASSRRLVEGRDSVMNGEWGPWRPTDLLGHDVSGTTLGVVGMGRIGTAVAERSVGFRMDVVYTARSDRPDVDDRLGARRVDLDELLATADHIVLAVPLTPGTRHLIGKPELASMKPSANLVNIARGAVIDTDALVGALASGSIRCAGLDVTDPEPIPADHPLVSLPNCLILPHMGSSTWRTRDAMANLAADNLIAGVLGTPVPCAVE